LPFLGRQNAELISLVQITRCDFQCRGRPRGVEDLEPRMDDYAHRPRHGRFCSNYVISARLSFDYPEVKPRSGEMMMKWSIVLSGLVGVVLVAIAGFGIWVAMLPPAVVAAPAPVPAEETAAIVE